MAVAFADYRRRRLHSDVFVANDTMPNLLFHNLGGKKFEEIGVAAGVAYPETATLSPAWEPISATSTTTACPISGTPPSSTRASRSTSISGGGTFVDANQPSGLGQVTDR